MASKVKCLYCGQMLNKEKDPCQPVTLIKSTRYVHEKCWQPYKATKDKEVQDDLNLNLYLQKIFNLEQLPPITYIRIKKLKTEYSYTSLGIHQALVYYYNIKKGNRHKKPQEALGIVPYVYDEAKQYYLTIQQTNWANEKRLKDPSILQEEISLPKTITIPVPQRKQGKKKKLFTFLEEDFE